VLLDAMRLIHHLILLLLLTVASNAIAQKKELPAYKYKHMLSPNEENFRGRLGKSFIETAPPEGPVRNIAEFEPMSGVVIAYPFGIPMNLIKALAEKDTVITIVANAAEENSVRSQYESNGLDLSYCKFFHSNTDSYWTRDYSPLFVVDGNHQLGIVNFKYNRPRPNDDDIPMKIADYLDMPWYGMNVVHTGGNYMTDGYGISASTNIVYTESETEGISNEAVDKSMLFYLGVSNYHVLDDPNNTYIDHIDCWGKFLDVDKIMIRKVPSWHAQFAEIEAMAEYWENQTSSWGNSYQVYRVNTPNDQPYTNSLILNGRVFVPLTGASEDQEALDTYKKAMPGYEILGFESNDWLSTDALHCRTHEIADKHMLEILHKPFLGNQFISNYFNVFATIHPLSGKGLYADSAFVNYRVNNGTWTKAKLCASCGENYVAVINTPGEGSKVEYYIQATDSSGRTEFHPYIGKYDPHIFYVGDENPYLEFSHNEITFPGAEYQDIILSIENYFNQDIKIENINSESLKYCQIIESNPELDYPINLITNAKIELKILPLAVTKGDSEYNTDTLKISTADSLYSIVIKCDKSYMGINEEKNNWNSTIYPNPFSSQIHLTLQLPTNENLINASVLTLSGQKIVELPINKLPGNNYSVRWNATTNLSPGIYFIAVQTENESRIFKIMKH